MARARAGRSLPTFVTRVDADGLSLWSVRDRVLDVMFDDRRVWSFWTLRDTKPGGRGGRRRITWPQVLREFMDGRTRITVRDHVSGRELFDEERAFGDSPDRIAVVNRSSGAPMGLDKSGRMSATFDTRSDSDVVSLLTAIESVLEVVRAARIDAFLAYGTLLGAVREGGFLGHDSDADLAYVSRHSHPVDVVRESFRLQRLVNQHGFATYRYSGAAFRVDVEEADGMVRGLDVFAGFIDAGRLYLMGEIGADFRMEWIYPLGTAQLEGRMFAVPAEPERLLEAAYGPAWRVPDPAFKFETSPRTQRQLDGWFRGTASYRPVWERRFSTLRNTMPRQGPSRLARRVRADLPEGARVIEVGAGRGGDSLWLARRGFDVVAYDYVPDASRAVQRVAARKGLPLEVRNLNLLEWRSVFAEGARQAHGPKANAVFARHVLDATPRFGRESLVRFAAMTLHDGGTLYVDVWTGAGHTSPRLRAVGLDDVARLVTQQGGTVTWSEELPYRSSGNSKGYSIGRLAAQWG